MLAYLYIITIIIFCCSIMSPLQAGKSCSSGSCAISTTSTTTNSSFDSSSGTFSSDSTSSTVHSSTGSTHSLVNHHTSKKIACKKGNSDFCHTSLFLPRPQYLDSAAFFNPYYYDCNGQAPCFSLDLGYRYTHTFNGERIARCLFGDNTLSFSGSKVRNRSKQDIVADYFGLSPDFKGRITFDPRIQNHIIDTTVVWDLGAWCSLFDKSYFRINSSFVHSIWNLHPCDQAKPPVSATFSDFPECYQSEFPVPAANDIPTALSGNFTFGDMNQEWHFGRFIFDDQSKTGLANIDLILGHDLIRFQTWHFGLFFKATAPTGNTPDGKTVFEPIIGNGHHWEVGGGLDAHWLLCGSRDQDLKLYINGSVTHLFNDTQFRSFDLIPESTESACLSRYVLLKELTSQGAYARRLINGIDFTTRQVKSRFDVQGDASIRIIYRWCNVDWAIGYNVYGRSKEKLTLVKNKCDSRNSRFFGIKGTTGVCAKGQCDDRLTGDITFLNATASTTRIFDQIAFVDNPVKVRDTQTDTTFITWDSIPSHRTTIAEDSRDTHDRPEPVLITTSDLAIRGIPSQITHKFFSHIDCQWIDCDYSPYVSLGGSVEFAQDGKCKVCTPNMWTLWLRGGIFY